MSSEDPSATSNSTDHRFKQNDWVLIRYLTQTYPGTVTGIVGTDIEVSVMERTGDTRKRWKWPEREDKIFYAQEDVLCHIQPPEVVGSRGQVVFNDLPQY